MKLNGCHNHEPFRTTMKVQDGYTEGGSHRIAHMVEVPFRMSFQCEYQKTELGKADKGCTDCKHRETA